MISPDIFQMRLARQYVKIPLIAMSSSLSAPILQTLTDSPLGFCPVLAEIVRTRGASLRGRTGEKGEDHFLSFSSVNNLLSLRGVMMEFKPKRTLEIGMAMGGSALALATSHRDLGRATEKQHVAIDPFQADFWDHMGVEALKQAGLEEYVDVRFFAPSVR